MHAHRHFGQLDIAECQIKDAGQDGRGRHAEQKDIRSGQGGALKRLVPICRRLREEYTSRTAAEADLPQARGRRSREIRRPDLKEIKRLIDARTVSDKSGPPHRIQDPAPAGPDPDPNPIALEPS